MSCRSSPFLFPSIIYLIILKLIDCTSLCAFTSLLRIPRSEVEEIANEVAVRLARMGRGFEQTICGGYVSTIPNHHPPSYSLFFSLLDPFD